MLTNHNTPAAWLVYDALLDFFYTPEDGALRLNPQLQGTVAVVHPLWWGLAEVSDNEIRLKIKRVFSDKPMSIRCVEMLGHTNEGGASYRRVELPEAVEIKPGAMVELKRK